MYIYIYIYIYINKTVATTYIDWNNMSDMLSNFDIQFQTTASIFDTGGKGNNKTGHKYICSSHHILYTTTPCLFIKGVVQSILVLFMHYIIAC